MSVSEKLIAVAENQQKVFDAGREKEWSDFWDALQQNGNLPPSNYLYGFAWSGWNDDTFYPKYDIYLQSYIFRESKITNLKQRLLDCGVRLKLSGNAQNPSSAFQGSTITVVPDISDYWLKTCTSMFANSEVETIEGIRFYNQSVFTNMFQNADKLKNITVYGEICKSIDFSYSPLTVDSMKSIISCLENFAGTSEEFVYEIFFTESCWAALEADSTSPTGTTWKEYVMYDLGWLT